MQWKCSSSGCALKRFPCCYCLLIFFLVCPISWNACSLFEMYSCITYLYAVTGNQLMDPFKPFTCVLSVIISFRWFWVGNKILIMQAYKTRLLPCSLFRWKFLTSNVTFHSKLQPDRNSFSCRILFNYIMYFLFTYFFILLYPTITHTSESNPSYFTLPLEQSFQLYAIFIRFVCNSIEFWWKCSLLWEF